MDMIAHECVLDAMRLLDGLQMLRVRHPPAQDVVPLDQVQSPSLSLLIITASLLLFYNCFSSLITASLLLYNRFSSLITASLLLYNRLSLPLEQLMDSVNRILIECSSYTGDARAASRAAGM